eukprot:GHVS01099218.1.p1 GENE.GHVS01099218.1~~GHVS01099218.1.p1  ORF type:complete len:174 (+),score=5.97 GHVS01099218.1:235-756(+)
MTASPFVLSRGEGLEEVLCLNLQEGTAIEEGIKYEISCYDRTEFNVRTIDWSLIYNGSTKEATHPFYFFVSKTWYQTFQNANDSWDKPDNRITQSSLEEYAKYDTAMIIEPKVIGPVCLDLGESANMTLSSFIWRKSFGTSMYVQCTLYTINGPLNGPAGQLPDMKWFRLITR